MSDSKLKWLKYHQQVGMQKKIIRVHTKIATLQGYSYNFIYLRGYKLKKNY